MRHMATNPHPSEERARIALNLVSNVMDLSDQAIADRVGLSRQQIEARRNGRTRIKVADIEVFAAKFEIPEPLWTGETADLLQWFADRERRGDTGTTRRNRRRAIDQRERQLESQTKAA